MANTLTGKTWTIDSLGGAITENSVIIHAIRLTWSAASAGDVLISSNPVSVAGGTAEQILRATTLALASGNIGLCTQEFSCGDQTYQGIRVVRSVGLASDGIEIVTK